MSKYYKQLPKTEEFLENMEDIIIRLSTDIDYFKKEEKELTEDYLILCEPMMSMARVFYNEAPEWAVELAKYIAVMNGDNYISNIRHIKE